LKNKLSTVDREQTTNFSATQAILALPRPTKRLTMVVADAVAIPTALWAALVLKFDRLDPVLDRTFAYFLVAIASALSFFSVFALYRAVIRFMGPSAMVTVIADVSLSVLVLAAFDGLCHGSGAAGLSPAIFSCDAQGRRERRSASRSMERATPPLGCARHCSPGRAEKKPGRAVA
jgi:hypothetical protein